MQNCEEKAHADSLREELLLPEKSPIEEASPADLIAAEEYCEGYKAFLNASKTEREAAREAVRLAADRGFLPWREGSSPEPGDRYYTVLGEKMTVLFIVGKQPMKAGINISAAHVDCPRLDLKPSPLAEDGHIAYFKTHYYGGIRKYQWPTIPLELHGVIYKEDGEKVEIAYGASEEDPVLCISDLLPHLGGEQNGKPLGRAIPGESLRPMIGSVPCGEDEKKSVKLAVMSILSGLWGITEKDFVSSELSLVPAGKARDVGFDRSLIGSYGQDDRVCGYASLRALLDLEEIPEKTAMVVLADKEEIGSEGISGMKSARFDHLVSALCGHRLEDYYNALDRSFCLSCDVTAAFDPTFADVFEKGNSAFLNGGCAICKYTGGGGKSGASDASAEAMAKLRKVFKENGVVWQTCELGKVDAGGGGTVAKYMAERGIETVDAGTPVISMHSPFELTSKFDCYHTYLANKAVFSLE